MIDRLIGQFARNTEPIIDRMFRQIRATEDFNRKNLIAGKILGFARSAADAGVDTRRLTERAIAHMSGDTLADTLERQVNMQGVAETKGFVSEHLWRVPEERRQSLRSRVNQDTGQEREIKILTRTVFTEGPSLTDA